MSSKTKKHQSTLHKKSYSSPLLTHFGAIKELTFGGSIDDNEFGMGSDPLGMP